MSNTNDPFGGLLQGWSSLAGALPGAAAGGGPAPLVALLVQAHVASSASLLRAGQRGSESWLQYLKECGNDAPLEWRVDAARAHLRRLGEIAADESRQIAHQLAGLDEQIRALVTDPPAPTGTAGAAASAPGSAAPAPGTAADGAAPVRLASIKP